MPGEGVVSHRARVTGGCERLDVDAGSRIQELFKSIMFLAAEILSAPLLQYKSRYTVDSHDSLLWEITKLDQSALISRKR